MMQQDSRFDVSRLCITLRPIARSKDGTSVLESMWSSMSSSMQLAQDYIDEDSEFGNIQEPNAMEGLERVAQTIDNGGLLRCFLHILGHWVTAMKIESVLCYSFK